MSRPLLLYLGSAADPGRFAVGPTLAALAERAGWTFDCYYDSLRRGRHFGGGPPEDARRGWAAGSLVAGGRHADQVVLLATAYSLVAVGDPDSILWPAVESAGAEVLLRSTDPIEIYRAAFGRLEQPFPSRGLLVDGRPQGPHAVVAAPYLFPAFFADVPALGLELDVHGESRRAFEQLGIGADLLDAEEADQGYAQMTAALARRYAAWGQGVLLGDPDLVAAQLPKAARLRLLPLYGRPQTDVLSTAADRVRAGREPVYGRQYDDRDFFELARLGHGLQVLDPAPPFDAAHALGAAALPVAETDEPGDEQLIVWADEGRVLVTLLFWAGMVRELECVPRLIDLAAETGLRAGLLVTAETLAAGGPFSLDLLAAPQDRGGARGLLELLLGSTGRGVAAEHLLPPGSLEQMLGEARSEVAARLPGAPGPRGWWPLLDASLVPHRALPVGRRNGRPVVYFTPRHWTAEKPGPDAAPAGRRDVRALAGAAVRRLGLDSLFEERRPFGRFRPGALSPEVVAAVRSAGFSYMWSKSGFGQPRVLHREGDFVVLSLTAGNWDGWSPFYTLGSPRDLTHAERRLLRSGPGWLVGTIDSPLWAMSGETLEHGSTLYSIAQLAADGGRSGRLVNVTPNVVARYARLLHDRTSVSDKRGSPSP